MRLRLTLEYDGTDFAGWARQPGSRTVEGSLRTALDQTYGRWSGLAVAGRTDAGVHALGQVASVDVEGGPPVDRAARALNTRLPPDVAVLDAAEALPGFDARFSASARTYRYRIWRRPTASPFERTRSWWLPGPLDLDRVEAAAAAVVGEHDFRAFTPADTQHTSFTRVVEECRWETDADVLALVVTADGFLRHMVRTLVGTMVAQEPQRVAELLGGRPRTHGGATAPPHGLYLVAVRYG